MWIAIREQGVAVSSAGRAYAAERIEQTLTNVAGYVRRVSVYLSDQNGPRGGADKQCRVAVTLVAGPSVHVETRGPSLAGTVDGAAEKVGHRVQESVRRAHDRRRTRSLVRALKRVKTLLGRKGDMP